MAGSAWVIHDKAKKYIGNGVVDLDDDVLKARLYLSTSNVSTSSVDGIASATDEVSGNGYAEQTLTNVTWEESGGTVTLDCDAFTFVAAGGDITARYAVIYDDTADGKPVLCHMTLDDTPANVTATDTNSITVTPPAGGIFQVS